jgi:hypothetical protein
MFQNPTKSMIVLPWSSAVMGHKKEALRLQQPIAGDNMFLVTTTQNSP